MVGPLLTDFPLPYRWNPSMSLRYGLPHGPMFYGLWAVHEMAEARPRSLNPVPCHSVEFAGFMNPKLGGGRDEICTTLGPELGGGKLTFDERIVLHRVAHPGVVAKSWRCSPSGCMAHVRQ